MTNTESQPSRRRRLSGWHFTRRSASLAIALLLIAAPAGASIIIQNYMEADITAAAPCFVKLEGTDPATSTQATFDTTTNTIPIDGVDLLEEKLTITGMTGDRVIYTDLVVYQNNCAEPVDVTLLQGEATTWADPSTAVQIWLSNVDTPANVDPNAEAPTDDWNNTFIDIAGDGTVVSDTTGTVTVLAGGHLHGAIVVSTDTTFTAGTNTANWIAQAVIN